MLILDSKKSKIHLLILMLTRAGFRLVGALGSTKCGGPPTKVILLDPITCFESFRALVLLQIREHSVLKLIKRIDLEENLIYC